MTVKETNRYTQQFLCDTAVSMWAWIINQVAW
jgi:hypothetical protein